MATFENGDTFVERLFKNRDWESIELLIIAGLVNEPIDRRGNTLLHYLVKHAIYSDITDLVYNPQGPPRPRIDYPQIRLECLSLTLKLLLNGVDIHKKNKERFTPLEVAFKHSNDIPTKTNKKDFFNLLELFITHRSEDLKKNPSILNQNIFGEPLLFFLRGDVDVLERVIYLGADVNIKGTRGQTLFSEHLISCNLSHFNRTLFDQLRKVLLWGADVNVTESPWTKTTSVEALLNEKDCIHVRSRNEIIKLIIELRGSELNNRIRELCSAHGFDVDLAALPPQRPPMSDLLQDDLKSLTIQNKT